MRTIERQLAVRNAFGDGHAVMAAMLPIRITLQTAEGGEVVVFADEVTSERLCSTLSIAENTLRVALGVLQTDAMIREYIGTQMVKCVNVGRADNPQPAA